MPPTATSGLGGQSAEGLPVAVAVGFGGDRQPPGRSQGTGGATDGHDRQGLDTVGELQQGPQLGAGHGGQRRQRRAVPEGGRRQEQVLDGGQDRGGQRPPGGAVPGVAGGDHEDGGAAEAGGGGPIHVVEQSPVQPGRGGGP